jgi:hypothetical protein
MEASGMTRSARQLLLILLGIALLVGVITPTQLGGWVRTAAAWIVEAAGAVVGG